MRTAGGRSQIRSRHRPGVLIAGGRKSGPHGYSRSFIAGWDSDCSRCPRPIKAGDEIRYHDDYPDVVHVGCNDGDIREPEMVIVGARQPKLCTTCFMEHAGECL